ncbi:MAG: FtsX-like permease family protein [Rubricoccaceae bacterium]|nr:FtsX-like permease family protein [Rubricoccaceae bacterium]
MDYRLLIARRYLVSRRRVTLISVVSGISVAGVALGVAALIVVLSVMNGFYDTVRDLLVSYDPHVRIEAADGQPLAEADALLGLVRDVPGVVTAAPFVEGKALLAGTDARGLNRVVTVRGVDPAALDSTVARAVTAGVFDVSRTADGPGLVAGRALATRLALFPGAAPGDDLGGAQGVAGSRVALLSAPALERMATMYPLGLPPQQVFALRGLFELEPAYDEDHVFVGLEEAQRLFRLPAGRVSGLDLRLTDVEDAAAVQARLQDRLGGDYAVKTWYDLQPSLYSVMLLEKWAASAILLLIVVVAAFNIVGALTMIVIEKRRDLGALQAMGASRRDVARVFLLEGLLVGGLGAGLGLGLGLGLAILQETTGLVKLAEAESFIISAYPVSVRLSDVALIAAVAVGLCVLAAVYPARRAAAVEPAEAVRSGA